MADNASEVSRSSNVKNMFERNSTDVLIMVEFSKKIHSLPRVVFDQNCGELSCSSIPFCDCELKNCIAAEAAQFLYEACAPYQRYGQGFNRSAYPPAAAPCVYKKV